MKKPYLDHINREILKRCRAKEMSYTILLAQYEIKVAFQPVRKAFRKLIVKLKL